jgi:hypothetical protein
MFQYFAKDGRSVTEAEACDANGTLKSGYRMTVPAKFQDSRAEVPARFEAGRVSPPLPASPLSAGKEFAAGVRAAANKLRSEAWKANAR